MLNSRFWNPSPSCFVEIIFQETWNMNLIHSNYWIAQEYLTLQVRLSYLVCGNHILSYLCDIVQEYLTLQVQLSYLVCDNHVLSCLCDIAQEYPTLQCLCDIEQESMWHWDVSNITGSAFIVGMWQSYIITSMWHWTSVSNITVYVTLDKSIQHYIVGMYPTLQVQPS